MEKTRQASVGIHQVHNGSYIGSRPSPVREGQGWSKATSCNELLISSHLILL